MDGKTKKSIVKPGETIQVLLPDGKNFKAKVRMAEGRYLWIAELLDTDQHPKMRGMFFVVYMARGLRNYSFKAVLAGIETINDISMTKLIAVTEATDDNRREAYRLYKLFDLSVSRKYGDHAERSSIACQGLDISDTGIGFASTQWFQFGEIIECRFTLDETRYHLSAKIVRVIRQTRDDQEKVYHIGAVFLRAGDNIRKSIRRYIYLQQTVRRKRMKKESNE